MTRILVICTLLLFAACVPGPHAVVDGVLRDTIFSYEPRANGSISIWMLHDDVGDKEANPIVGASGCATEERKQTTVYKILSIERVGDGE